MMQEGDLAVRYDGAAWLVLRSDGKSVGGPVSHRREAEVAAIDEAGRRPPCWVRIYTPGGLLHVAWHAR